jgi:hypothetical protein
VRRARRRHTSRHPVTRHQGFEDAWSASWSCPAAASPTGT